MAAILTTTLAPYQGGPPVRRYTLAWTSHTDGSVHINTDPILGESVRVEFVPGAGGTQPTDLYDMVLLDTAGIDVLAGQGANLSNSTKSHVCPGVPVKDGTTTLTRPINVAEPLNLQV